MPKARPSRARSPRVAIIASRYNASITDALVAGAQEACQARAGVQAQVIPAPGSYELPALALAAAESGRFDGVVAIGCLIQGETRHDQVIGDAVAQGLVGVTLLTGVPVTFGVLTVKTAAQAKARAGGRQGNKGADAMNALLDTLAAMALIAAPAKAATPSRRLPDKAKGRTSR
ncbi:MAG: 6,7-dimethyl-8-ribityllumazine synthase [Phycisphaerales bacterium]|nr:6,7-dimethyl-8-ribityllumazine synthase [Phycisphaerales bacterium]